MELVTYSLVTLENTKSFLGITNNEQDDLIKLLINQATDYIESKTNRRFKQTTYTNEKYDGTGRRTLQLNSFPVVTFTKLEKNNATDNSDDWTEIASSNYWVDEEDGIITKTSAFVDYDDNVDEGLTDGSLFSTGKNKYRATYSAGYATIPYDIQFACMSLVGESLNNRKAMGIKSESLGDHSITFESIYQRNSGISLILDGYRDINL